jgi:hypothetical protein
VDHRGEAYDGRSYIESSHINMVAFKGTENAHLVLSLLVLSYYSLAVISL